MSLLAAALGSTCWLWVSRVDPQITGILGEQARQTAVTLALAARPAFAAGDVSALRSMGGDLLKSRDILFLAFYDPIGKNIAFTDRQSSASADFPTLQTTQVSSLAQVRMGHSQLLGDYLEVCQPVLLTQPGKNSSRLLGYVSVGISPTAEKLQAQRVNYFATGIGCIVILCLLPLAYVLVHRIFLPIRQLVEATDRISNGDLDSSVAIDRADAIGDLARSFNIMIDTVQRQQLVLRRSNVDLEQIIAQRTAQLETANRQLSSEIAEKEDFLRAISHDLNAPLRNISGMTTMLLAKHSERLDSEIVHRLQRIQKNVEAETDLISELLEISRIKTRREKMEMVDTTALVNEIAELLENDLNSRQIQLTLDTPLPVLNGERSRFRQIFQNLIDNAIKYMGDGPIREIHIGCTIRFTDVEFYVRDTGMGIEPDDVGKVFCIFRRGKNSAALNIPGKGVGLSCVKSIIETYNGTISVQSAPGKGSTFKFTINGQYVPEAVRLSKAGVTP